jgi:hypothetical protein
VKSYFQFLLTGALLLVGLMLYNGQRPENADRTTDHQDYIQVDQQAEVCFSQMFGSSVPSFPLVVKADYRSPSDHPNRPEIIHFSTVQNQYKSQMQVHLDLKPGLSVQSGQNLHRFSSYGDPPLA